MPLTAHRVRPRSSPRRFAALSFALLALQSAPAASVTAQEEPPSSEREVEAPRVADLAFLAGTWRGTVEGAGPEPEQVEVLYSTPDGALVLSVTKALGADGRASYFEFERFAEEAGAVVLTPYPGGKPAARFRLETLDRAARQATFANPENEWPQRIRYARVADDRLEIEAWGEGPARLRVKLRLR